MAGFRQDPIQFINLIADNLRDRYQTGFPVLKELIQNTDDASATELHYGISPGLPEAEHPLLKGKSIFFINNGAFKATDYDGIRSFGQNSKAADQSTIGKFGLGMKSVFHFCEAFFFLTHDEMKPRTEILNPWSGPEDDKNIHRDWDAFSEHDIQTMRIHLSSITEKITSPHSFILWLPLRKESHLRLSNGTQSGSIVSEYPGDDATLLEFLDEENLAIKIASLLPLLRHIEQISYWNLQRNEPTIEPIFHIQLGDKAKRPSLIETTRSDSAESKPTSNDLNGKITVSYNEAGHKLEYSGLERLAWSSELRSMRDDNLWPSSHIRDRSGRSYEAKDKAQPHGVTFFSKVPGEGSLTTNWSVFLPLDEGNAAETLPCSGEYEYRLTLHGYFFVDAGRQRIHGINELAGLDSCLDISNEETLRKAWNSELLKKVVLPLLLPSLDKFRTERSISDKDCSALSSALNNSRLLKDFKKHISAKHNWLRELTQEGLRWSLRGHEKKVLSLPEPPATDSTKPWRLFGSLKDVAQKYYLSVEGAPNIVHPESKATWCEDELSTLLDGIDYNTLFSDGTLLDYFTQFLRGDAARTYIGSASVKKVLAKLIRQGLINLGENSLGNHQKRIQKIVGYLDQDQRFKVDDQMSPTLLKQLLSTGIDVLLIPKRFFASDLNHKNALSIEDATMFLKKIDEFLGGDKASDQDSQKNALRLSEEFIKAVSAESRSNLLQRCAYFHVLEAYDCKARRKAPVSVHDLQSAKDNFLLFGYGEGVNEQKRLCLAPQLQQILPHDRVLIINKSTATLAINATSAQKSCDAKAVLQSLGHKTKTLGDMQARIALAGRVVLPESGEEKRGLRFLLHADWNHFEDDSTTLWISGTEQHSVWRDLWAQLEGGDGNPWNLLNSEIANKLSRDVSSKIGIKEISAKSILEKIQECGNSELDPSQFNQDECEEILCEVNDDELWKSLPFHWTTLDQAVAGNDDKTYLMTKDAVTVDAKLLEDIHLIRCSKNPLLKSQQKKLLKHLDHLAVIEIILSRPDSSGFWRMIMDTLEASGNSDLEDLIEKVKSHPWLPSDRNKPWKPEDIVDLDGLETEIDRILAQESGVFTTPARLDDAIKQHSFYSELRKDFFSHGSDALKQLALVIDGLDKYYIGNIGIEKQNDLKETVNALSSYEHAGWRLLDHLIEKISLEACFKILLPAMKKPMRLDDIVSLLQWLTDQASTLKASARTFNSYLSVFAGMPKAEDALGDLKLLNKADRWKSSSKLVSGVSGIDAKDMLDDMQSRILSGITFHADVSDNNPYISSQRNSSVKLCAKELRKYFNPWQGRVADPLIAAFVLLFGGDVSVKALCEELLGQYPRDWLICQMPWVVPRGTEDGSAKRKWLCNKNLEQALDFYQMTVQIHSDQDIQVFSILGEDIHVGVAKEFDGLLLGMPNYTSNNNGYQVDLILRKVNVNECSDKQLSNYLCQTISQMLTGKIYEQKRIYLDDLWREIDVTDQIDTDLARDLILQNIPFYLKHLGAHKEPSLKSCIDAFRDKMTKEREFKGIDKDKESQYRKEKEDALKKLQNTIETDEKAQVAILNAVRNKIKIFQYQKESVPFELFQNADDALHDLTLIDAYPGEPGDPDVEPLPNTICRFVIEADQNVLRFMSWGRAINQCGSRGFSGEERGFDRDLENMLILSASDKGEDVTGKFGLGFKSVWLITETPSIVSGRLQTSIVGGLLPGNIHGEGGVFLRSRLSNYQPDKRWPGTAISLPLVDDITEDQVLKQFSNVAGVMVAFARNIRTIEINHENGAKKSFAWGGEQLPGCDHIMVGHIRQSDDDLLVMKIELKDGALLLVIDAEQGFVELPKDILSLWATAPIKEPERLGFAINAMFDVDVGRSRLAANQDGNRELARKLGRQLGCELNQLRCAVENQWAEVAKMMHLSPKFESSNFWLSLWRVLIARLPTMKKEFGSRIIGSELLSQGLKPLAEQHDIIPNGLPGTLQQQIRWQNVKTVMQGALAKDSILLAAAKVSCFHEWLDTKGAVSAETAIWLRMLISNSNNEAKWVPIQLSALMKRLSENGAAIEAGDATILGEVLNSNALESMEASNSNSSQKVITDFKEAQKAAKELIFFPANGMVVKAKYLLIKNGNNDESLRWGFAPDSARLSDVYDKSAINFVLFCRDKLDAPAEKLKEWVFEADDSDKRKAALWYLLKGDLSNQVTGILLQSGLSGTWLEGIDEKSEYLADWSPDDIAKLIFQRLKTSKEIQDAFTVLAYQHPSNDFSNQRTPEPIPPQEALLKIYEWWENNRDSEIKTYNNKNYPEGRKLNLKDDDAGYIDRSSWLTLLLLGGFRTMGRTKPEQHRTFIERIQRNKSWDTFIAPDPSKRFDEWMMILDEFIGSQIDQQEYEQWMMRFPTIYKLSRYLDEYAELLSGIERCNGHFDLNLVLSPKVDPSQQGGGISAPPLGKTLGIGANFVIRELIRYGIIDSPFLHRHAYVPSGKVRRLIQEMGGDIDGEDKLKKSPAIYSFLCQYIGEKKSLFLGDYDIPLRIVSLDEDLQSQLLGRALTSESDYL